MQIAVDLDPSINNKLELAYQIYLSGQYEEAIKIYADLIKDEEHVPKAIEGIVLCHIAMNNINVEVNIIFNFIKLSYFIKNMLE
jgi:hypothetical protein